MSRDGFFPNSPRPTAARSASAALIVLLLLLTSCTRRSASAARAGDLQIHLDAESRVVGRTSLTIRISDGSGEPVSGALVSVRGDMSHPGMTPILAEAREAGSGVYRAEFDWTMAGDWIVTVSVDRSGHEQAHQQFELSIAGPDG